MDERSAASLDDQFPSFPFYLTRVVDIVLTLSPSEMVARCRNCPRSVEMTICVRRENARL